MTWYDPQEIKDEADGAQTQPEFDPETVTEDPIVEGSLSVDGAQELLDRQAEVVTIVATIDNGDEPVVS